MKSYAECIEDIQNKKPSLTKRELAAMVGVHESVLSKRVAGKQNPTGEALVVINTLRDIICLTPIRREAFAKAVSPGTSSAYWLKAIETAGR